MSKSKPRQNREGFLQRHDTQHFAWRQFVLKQISPNTFPKHCGCQPLVPPPLCVVFWGMLRLPQNNKAQDRCLKNSSAKGRGEEGPNPLAMTCLSSKIIKMSRWSQYIERSKTHSPPFFSPSHHGHYESWLIKIPHWIKKRKKIHHLIPNTVRGLTHEQDIPCRTLLIYETPD